MIEVDGANELDTRGDRGDCEKGFVGMGDRGEEGSDEGVGGMGYDGGWLNEGGAGGITEMIKGGTEGVERALGAVGELDGGLGAW